MIHEDLNEIIRGPLSDRRSPFTLRHGHVPLLSRKKLLDIYLSPPSASSDPGFAAGERLPVAGETELSCRRHPNSVSLSEGKITDVPSDAKSFHAMTDVRKSKKRGQSTVLDDDHIKAKGSYAKSEVFLPKLLDCVRSLVSTSSYSHSRLTYV